ALEITHYVRAVKASAYIVHPKTLRTVAYFFQEGAVCKKRIVARRGDKTYDERAVVKFLQLRQRGDRIAKIPGGRRAESYGKTFAIKNRSVFCQLECIRHQLRELRLVVDSVVITQKSQQVAKIIIHRKALKNLCGLPSLPFSFDPPGCFVPKNSRRGIPVWSRLLPPC